MFQVSCGEGWTGAGSLTGSKSRRGEAGLLSEAWCPDPPWRPFVSGAGRAPLLCGCAPCCRGGGGSVRGTFPLLPVSQTPSQAKVPYFGVCVLNPTRSIISIALLPRHPVSPAGT